MSNEGVIDWFAKLFKSKQKEIQEVTKRSNWAGITRDLRPKIEALRAVMNNPVTVPTVSVDGSHFYYNGKLINNWLDATRAITCSYMAFGKLVDFIDFKKELSVDVGNYLIDVAHERETHGSCISNNMVLRYLEKYIAFTKNRGNMFSPELMGGNSFYIYQNDDMFSVVDTSNSKSGIVKIPACENAKALHDSIEPFLTTIDFIYSQVDMRGFGDFVAGIIFVPNTGVDAKNLSPRFREEWGTVENIYHSFDEIANWISSFVKSLEHLVDWAIQSRANNSNESYNHYGNISYLSKYTK